jgi:two-component system response regulator AlgR
LQRQLATLPDIEVLAEAETGTAAVSLARELNPDVVLLDIRMPVMNGIAAAKEMALMETPPAVIFCTAYSDYALAGFEAQAIAYLLKPISQDKLAQALTRCRQLNRAQLQSLHGVDEEQSAPSITVSDQRHTRRLPLNEVFAFIADTKYVTAVTENGNELLNDSLKQLEQAYPTLLLRVHRNTLINRHRLLAVVNDPKIGWCAELRGTPLRPQISRRHLGLVKQALAED